MAVNKYKDLVINKYTDFDEDSRLFRDRAHNVEYLTTMRYIEKFLKPDIKILEVGAATGRYSIALAKMGYDVTAVELTPSYVEIMKRKGRGIKNFQCMEGDALDLSTFPDNSFDMVLNFGPMYHLFSEKDKKQAILESLRVAKKDAVCMFAYRTHASVITSKALLKGTVAQIVSKMDKTGRIKDIPEDVFVSYYAEDFKKLFTKMNTKYLTTVAANGIALAMDEQIEKLSKKDYQAFLKWHFMTCERPDQQGLSSHLLYICKKSIAKSVKQIAHTKTR